MSERVVDLSRMNRDQRIAFLVQRAQDTERRFDLLMPLAAKLLTVTKELTEFYNFAAVVVDLVKDGCRLVGPDGLEVLAEQRVPEFWRRLFAARNDAQAELEGNGPKGSSATLAIMRMFRHGESEAREKASEAAAAANRTTPAPCE